MQDKQLKKIMDFKRQSKKLFNTPTGMKVIAYLKDSYVDNTALGKDTNETMYKLGQKEFVQSLVRLINEPEVLDDIIVRSTITEE